MNDSSAYKEGVATGTVQFREHLRVVAEAEPSTPVALANAFAAAHWEVSDAMNPYQVSAAPGPSRSRVEPFIQWSRGFCDSYFDAVRYAEHVNVLLLSAGQAPCWDANYFVQVRSHGLTVEQCANEFAGVNLAILSRDEVEEWELRAAAGSPAAAIWKDMQDRHPRLPAFAGCWNAPDLSAANTTSHHPYRSSFRPFKP